MNVTPLDDYDPIHAAMYDYQSFGVEGDVEFYVQAAREAGTTVVELGCGTGRIVIPTAEAGVRIIGIDSSAPMLTICREKVARLPEAVRARIELVEGDMRSFSLDDRFGLVTVPYRAFLHLLTPRDQRQALKCIREHLLPTGRLILDVFDPRTDIIQADTGPHGSAVTRDGEFTLASGRRVVVWGSRERDLEAQITHQRWVFEELDEQGCTASRVHAGMHLRYVYRYEMEHLLELSGYRVEALYGDFRRGPFRHGGEQIWVARRA